MFKELFQETLKESSLSRLWGHNEEHDCGAMTAFRLGRDCNEGKVFTKKEKMKKNLALAADLKALKYNITKIIGKYPEGTEDVKEVSYFIVDVNDQGELAKDIINLGKKYDQDSVLFIPKGAIQNKDKAYLTGTNDCKNNWLRGGTTEVFNKGKMGYDSPIYTSYIHGRPFLFEDVPENAGIIFGSSSNAALAFKYSKEIEK